MTCAFSQYDGAYVLGSLSPTDRRGFGEHLAGCPHCSHAVAQLAGLPGLLARVPVDVLDEPDPEHPADPPPPPDVLPALLREVRRERRRRTRIVAGIAAAAAVAVLGGSVAVVTALDDDPPRQEATQQPGAARSMTRVGDVPMSASVSLTPVDWGTRLDLTCSYAAPAGYEGGYGGTDGWQLVLVVRTASGRTEEVATWRARPGQNMQLTGATALEADEIVSVEVRSAAGAPVMRLTT